MEPLEYFKIILIIVLITYTIHIVFGINSTVILPLLIILLGLSTFGFIIYFVREGNSYKDYLSLFSILLAFFIVAGLFFAFIGMPN
jgi:hypothetical protein